ncbi:MAG: TIGR03790 family protein [Bdellovibrionales bacterium]|nr:TIGR03790 family protein [Bdellovibrionales bacterium]
MNRTIRGVLSQLLEGVSHRPPRKGRFGACRRCSGSPTLLRLALFLAFIPRLAIAEISPDQVAVIANEDVPDSIALAEHYVRSRGIPTHQLFRLKLPGDETISRQAFEEKLVTPLRQQLAAQKFPNRIRVLVTTFGVPLHVLAPKTGQQEQDVLELAAKQKARADELLRTAMLSAVAIAPKDNAPPSPQNTPSVASIQSAAETIGAAVARTNALAPEARQRAANELIPVVLQFGGLAALGKTLRPQSPNDAAATERLEQLDQQVRAGMELLRALDFSPSLEHRRKAYELTERLLGASGMLARAERDLAAQQYKDADASVDSELTLLWWDRGTYALSDRLPNPLFYQHSLPSTLPPTAIPLMMVSRLDGSNLTVAKQMIDGALHAERDGLVGEAFIDARGLPYDAGNEFAAWDQNLRDLAWMVRRTTDYKTNLDTHSTLLQKGHGAALYVGWYSLRNYQDVFSFTPGAIAIHIASEEAVSLRDPDERGWCKNLLDHGAAVTIGAVAEPYLEAFPKPRQFLGLLLTGRYSLVEAYYLTLPYISWRMVLLGDPLYNPWRGRFEMPLQELDLHDREQNPLTALPSPLGAIPTNDPVRSRTELRTQVDIQQAELDRFLRALEKQTQEQPPAPKLP